MTVFVTFGDLLEDGCSDPETVGGTFWVAVCFGCYAFIEREHRAGYGIRQPWSFWIPENAFTVAMMVTPFIAAASFFGRTLLGVLIGVVAVAAFWFLWSLT